MINLIRALAVRENACRLLFDADVYFSNVLDPGDASDPDRYVVSAVTASIGSDGLPPREVRAVIAELYSPREVDLWMDRRFSPAASLYTVTANNLRDTGGGALVLATAAFMGVRGASGVALTPDHAVSNADLANPQTLSGALDPLPVPTDAVLGTLPVDETGDLARDMGLESYRKRVIRRLTTQKGRFRQEPAYGTLFVQSVKQLGRPGFVAALIADAEDQIKQEPETIDCAVTVERKGNAFFFLILARCNLGKLDLSAPIQIG